MCKSSVTAKYYAGRLIYFLNVKIINVFIFIRGNTFKNKILIDVINLCYIEIKWVHARRCLESIIKNKTNHVCPVM